MACCCDTATMGTGPRRPGGSLKATCSFARVLGPWGPRSLSEWEAFVMFQGVLLEQIGRCATRDDARGWRGDASIAKEVASRIFVLSPPNHRIHEVMVDVNERPSDEEEHRRPEHDAVIRRMGVEELGDPPESGSSQQATDDDEPADGEWQGANPPSQPSCVSPELGRHSRTRR